MLLPEDCTALQSQKAVNANLKSKQLLPFRFVALQSQTAVTSYFSSEKLLPFGFARQYIGVSVSAVGAAGHGGPGPRLHCRLLPAGALQGDQGLQSASSRVVYRRLGLRAEYLSLCRLTDCNISSDNWMHHSSHSVDVVIRWGATGDYHLTSISHPTFYYSNSVLATVDVFTANKRRCSKVGLLMDRCRRQRPMVKQTLEQRLVLAGNCHYTMSRPPGLEFRILCLEDSVISIISPSSGGSPGPV